MKLRTAHFSEYFGVFNRDVKQPLDLIEKRPSTLVLGHSHQRALSSDRLESELREVSHCCEARIRSIDRSIDNISSRMSLSLSRTLSILSFGCFFTQDTLTKPCSNVGLIAHANLSGVTPCLQWPRIELTVACLSVGGGGNNDVVLHSSDYAGRSTLPHSKQQTL